MYDEEKTKKEALRATEEGIKRKQCKSVKDKRSNEQQRGKRNTYKERMSERDGRPPRCPALHNTETDRFAAGLLPALGLIL